MFCHCHILTFTLLLQIFEYLCAAHPADHQLEPEELSHQGVPDMRAFLMCEDYNFRECNICVPGCFHEPDGDILVAHVCNYRMTDGRPCSRQHPHLAHSHAIKQLRAARLLGGDVMVRALENSPGIILEGFEESAAYYMDRKDNMVPDTGPVVLWRAARLAANTVQHGRSTNGEPVTRYSQDHGVTWGDFYYDRSGGESELDISIEEDGTADISGSSDNFSPLLVSSASKKSCLAGNQVNNTSLLPHNSNQTLQASPANSSASPRSITWSDPVDDHSPGRTYSQRLSQQERAAVKARKEEQRKQLMAEKKEARRRTTTPATDPRHLFLRRIQDGSLPSGATYEEYEEELQEELSDHLSELRGGETPSPELHEIPESGAAANQQARDMSATGAVPKVPKFTFPSRDTRYPEVAREETDAGGSEPAASDRAAADTVITSRPRLVSTESMRAATLAASLAVAANNIKREPESPADQPASISLEAGQPAEISLETSTQSADTSPGAAAMPEEREDQLIDLHSEAGQPQTVRIFHNSPGIITVDDSGSNHNVVDAMLPSELDWATEVELVENERVFNRPNPIPAGNRLPRPQPRPGPPDYSCPEVTVEHIRLSAANRKPIKPAGIRVGDDTLPRRFEIRDQQRFQKGQPIFRDPADNVLRLDMGRAPTQDQFVVTGPLPCLKSIAASYMKFQDRRQCTQCDVWTHIGVLYVHGKEKATHGSNHFLCVSIASAKIAFLYRYL